MLNQNLLESVTQIAYQAGDEIMKVYRSDNFHAEYKSDDSPLTLADKKAHACILKELAILNPEFPILSEESEVIAYDTRKSWKTFWLVDPLDGTKEFLKKNDEFTVNIALIDHGFPVLGVVYAPATKVCYRAIKNFGAEKQVDRHWKKIHVSGDMKKPLNIVMSRSHPSETLNEFLKTISEFRAIEAGSSLKICYVAEGIADFYPRLGPTMEWDTAAAHCILNEAGGYLRTMKNESLKYNREVLKNDYFVAATPIIEASGILEQLYQAVDKNHGQ